MTLQELINKGSSAIRGNNELMSLFIKYYKENFTDEPSCYSCSWNGTFNKLAQIVNHSTINTRTMISQNKTFILKKGLKENMLSYKHLHRTYRLYIKDLNDNFVINFLTYGTEQEIEDRKKMFEKLPGFLESKEVKEVEQVEEVKEKKSRKKNK